MRDNCHSIRIGPCGWSYKDWVGPFYPIGTPAGDYLRYCAEQFPIVEVDSTFYGTPRPRMVANWRAKTPDEFGFSLKVPKSITHEKILRDCAAEVEEFLSAARLLEDKLLCCVLQFGYFNRAIFPDLDTFLERLDPFLAAWPKVIPVAVEIRNKAWVSQEFADFLKQHHAVWVLNDQEWMPAPWVLVRKLDVITGPFAYLRLLGDRALVDNLTKTLDHIVVDRSAEIDSDAQAVRLLSDRVPVLAFVNNHFAGYAPESIRMLQEAISRL
jgi:uncharacterized protein YecE (DUF72 family)